MRISATNWFQCLIGRVKINKAFDKEFWHNQFQCLIGRVKMFFKHDNTEGYVGFQCLIGRVKMAIVAAEKARKKMCFNASQVE